MGTKKYLILKSLCLLLFLSLNIVYANPPNSEFIIDSNTGGLWHFNEGSGNITLDATSNNNDGNIIGALWTTDDAPITGSSYSLDFNGTTDYVTTTSDSSLNPSTAMTVEAWINLNKCNPGVATPSGIHDIVSNEDSAAGFVLRIEGCKQLWGFARPGSNCGTGQTFNFSAVLGNWIHLAGTWDGKTIRTYINGTLESEIACNSYTSSTIPVKFGGNSAVGGFRGVNGSIDEIRVSNINRYPAILGTKVVQIVENVDLVKGKNTLLQVNVTSAPDDEVTVNVYLNDTLIGNGSTTLDSNGNGFVDAFFIPNINGNNIEINATLISDLTTFEATRSAGNFNIVETKDLNLVFFPINEVDFINSIDNNIGFLKDTYPLKENGVFHDVGYSISALTLPSNFEEQQTIFSTMIKDLLASPILEKKDFINVIGIVPDNYLNNYNESVEIQPVTGLNFGNSVLLFEESQTKTTAHEISHTFGLCDEYRSDVWENQDMNYPEFFGNIGNECPNGDIDNNGTLDNECENNNGCPTSTLPPLFRYDNITGSTTLRNLMGGSDSIPLESWISNNSYNALKEKLDINSNFSVSSFVQSGEEYMMVMGELKNDNTFEPSSYYTLNNGFFHNKSLFSGGYSFEVLNNGNQVISSIEFEPQFNHLTENGTVVESDRSFIVLTLPINQSASKIQFKNGTLLLHELNKTPNTPEVTVTFPLQDVSVSSMENIIWEASDIDNDTLSYAVILNKMNGTNSTLDFDLNQTSLSFNFSTVEEGNDYSLTILATDGFNTNISESGLFCVDKDLSVCGLKVLEANQTIVIFEFVITNNLVSSLNNLNWTLDTGDNNLINSTTLFNLTSKEDVFTIIEYDYGTSGNYTVTAIANAVNLTDNQTITITI